MQPSPQTIAGFSPKATYHGAAPPSCFSHPLSYLQVPVLQFFYAHTDLKVHTWHTSFRKTVTVGKSHAFIHKWALIQCDTQQEWRQCGQPCRQTSWEDWCGNGGKIWQSTAPPFILGLAITLCWLTTVRTTTLQGSVITSQMSIRHSDKLNY